MEDGIGQTCFDNDKHTIAFDDENYWGHAVYASVERSGRTWNMDLDYTEYSPTFRTDNGFTTRNDYRCLDLWTGWLFRPNREWLIQWEPSIDFGRIWDHDTSPNPFRFDEGARDEWVRFILYFRVKGQTNINIHYLNSRERFSGYLFEGISNFNFNVNSSFSEMLGGGVSFDHGKTIYRRHYREYDEVSDEGDTTHVVKEPDLGISTGFYTYLNIKPTQRLFIQPNFRYAKMNHSDRYLEEHPGEDKEIYSGYIFRTRFSYQFSREWDLRLVVQYNEFYDDLDIEPLLTYRLNPLEKSEWEIDSRQFFCKIQYLFRI